jgi:DNA-binding transcriptional LysR family regulator
MPLNLETVRAFVRVAELGNFTRAAQQIGVPKARVSQQVQRLEASVGARLLHRTTRAVRLTPDGDLFLARAKALLLETEDLGAMFAGPSALRGRVRIDLPVNLARDVLIPRMSELLAGHPQLELQVSTTDRLVDVVREGFDCVVRVATLGDSTLVATRLGQMEMINCASAAYLRKYGKPKSLADLDRHVLVHYSSALGSDLPEFEYHDGTRYLVRPMRAVVTVNNADAFQAACRAGLGIIQAPREGLTQGLASGDLVEILPKFRGAPLSVFLLHPHGRNVPRRVRLVLDWIDAVLRPHLEAGRRPPPS